jgi:hypothetical protein
MAAQDAPPEVDGPAIASTYFKIVKLVVYESLKMTGRLIVQAYNFSIAVIRILLHLLTLSPMYIVIVVVIILIIVIWDDVLKPLIEGIIEAINGIIGGYNGLVDAVSNVGFDMAGEWITILSIPLPRADEIHADIPKFIPFCLEILVPLLFMPIKQGLTGIIFA